MTEAEMEAQEMARKAWEDKGALQFGFIGTARVGFSIESAFGKFLACLSISGASEKKEKELVRLFFGDKKTTAVKGVWSTMYGAVYDAPQN